MKIVINRCFGSFGLSYKAVMRYAEIKGIKLYAYADDLFEEYVPKEGEKEPFIVYYYTKQRTGNNKEDNKNFFMDNNIDRTDLALVQVVEELKEEANTSCSELKVVDIPDNIEYEIDNYDGLESIHEMHRTWY